MSNYVDSILINKSIAKYMIQGPTWFAILIEIDNDTLRSYGSLQDIETPIKLLNDTIHVFEKTNTGQWALTLNKQTKQLELTNVDKVKSKDSNVYLFNKRPDLNFLLDTLDPVHYTSTSFTNFFHDRLFAGTYKLIGTNEKITFTNTGKVTGLQNFYRYEVDNYFGTLHPYKNLDNILFSRNLPENSKEFSWELFKWEFNHDTLILTQFDWKLYNYNGKYVRDGVWNLSDKQIKMIRTKNKF